jgi:hypothetical protein
VPAPLANTAPPKVNVHKPVGMQPTPSSNIKTLVADESSDVAAYAQSLYAQPAQPSTGMAGMQPMGMGAYPSAHSAPAAGGAFASQPSELSLFGAIPPPEVVVPPPAAGQQKLLFGVLPPRTAIMLAGALVVALGVLFMMPAEPPPRPVEHPVVDPALTAPQPPWTPPVPGPSAGEARVIHLHSNANPPAPSVAPGTRPPRNAPPPPPQTSFPERQAADLLFQNRIREAIPLYQALQTAHPDQPVYRDMVILLYRKLEAQLCPPGSPTPCTAMPPMPATPQAVPTAQPGAPIAPQAAQQPVTGVAR